jgi:hypothetical protein
MRNFITEEYRTRVVMGLQGTGSAADDYVLPTAGSSLAVLRCIVTMGNAADLTLTPKTATDATGTGAAALAEDVPIYVNGVRQDNDDHYKIEDATGDFIVDFIIDPKLIPDDAYIGMSYANSDAGNLMCCEIIESVAYKPTAT